MMDHRRMFTDKMQTQLDEGNRKIQEMRARAAEADANIKQDYQREVESLERQLKDARERFAKLQDSDETTWESIKSSAESAWEELTESLSKANRRFQR